MSCAWPVDRSCLPYAESDIDKIKQQNAEDLAVAVLWALSGRQFGVCPVRARPCLTPCVSYDTNWLSGPAFYPIWENGQWRNTMCGCGPRCAAVGPGVVHLAGPVVEITEVNIGGDVLDPSSYTLEGNLLYRTNGGVWPDQDLTRPLPEPGTWSVIYDKGNPVPAGVDVLVGVLALEFLNACSGGKCRIPRRVQTLSRGNVTYQMIDPTDIYASGKTGISEIDLWLSAVNPHANQQQVKVR